MFFLFKYEYIQINCIKYLLCNLCSLSITLNKDECAIEVLSVM